MKRHAPPCRSLLGLWTQLIHGRGRVTPPRAYPYLWVGETGALALTGVYSAAFMLKLYFGWGGEMSFFKWTGNKNSDGTKTPLTAPGYGSETTSATPHGANRDERLAATDAFYGNDLNAIEVGLNECIPGVVSKKSLDKTANVMADKLAQFNNIQNPNVLGMLLQAGETGLGYKQAFDALTSSVFRRTLRDLSDAERAALRLGDILATLGQLSPTDLLRIKVPILWNNGSCSLKTSDAYAKAAPKMAQLKEGLKMVIEGHFGDAAAASEHVQTALRAALAPGSTLLPDDRAILERYLFAGSRWLTPDEGATLAPSPGSPSALRLGTFPGSGRELMFDRSESLITVAPPGAGKSQAQVLRNLLYLDAPAVVLDIKGEMLGGSLTWRQNNVGHCFWFAPATPEHSNRYNPLDAISTNPDTAWDEARRLADMLVVTPKDYFDRRGRDMLTTVLLDVAMSEEGERRTMASVLDRLYQSDDAAIVEWCQHLDSLGLPQLRRQAKVIAGLPPKQREGIMDSARLEIEVWQSSSLEKLSVTSDFKAEDLRTHNATLYLCVNLEDVKKYASVLRVIIGQMVAGLCRATPESGARPVTFFLDELPRLGQMDVIEEALDVGRGFGVRLWMFCQNVGQLETAYPNAEGMISNCAVRCFMNPDENAAKKISEKLGEREGLMDGRRKPLATPSELTGPDFAEQMVVFLQKHHPARLGKFPAYADPVCVERMAPPS